MKWCGPISGRRSEVRFTLWLALLIATEGTVYRTMAAKTGDDLALQAPVINTAPGPEYGDDTRAFQGIPGMERMANGRLWATWYGGGTNEGPANYVMLVTSADDGATWSDLKLVIDPPGDVRAFDPCLWRDPDGKLWLFWAQGWSLWDGRAGVWAIVTETADSEDPTWSAPARLCDGIMMNKPTVLTTGEWLLPVAVWNRGPIRVSDPSNHHNLGDGVGSNVFASRDRGATWDLLGQAHVPDSQCDEHMIVQREDASLWMLVRTTYGIGESVSTDRGRTWGPGGPSGIPHVVARFFIRRLASGRLLLVRHDPPAEQKQRSHLTAYLSDDDGATWQGGLVIDERRGVSYPDGVQASDGTIYIIYDFSRTGEKQILMATFTEDDVLGGAFASDRARQRVLVNQATGGG
jgi:predicted neuraminidase